MNEQYFKEKIVVPKLIEEGHRIIKQKKPYKEINQREDILSIKEGITYISEVKFYTKNTMLSALQKAIGQLIIYQFLNRKIKRKKFVYQIVFPTICEYAFSPAFLEFLSSNNIKIKFVNIYGVPGGLPLTFKRRR